MITMRLVLALGLMAHAGPAQAAAVLQNGKAVATIVVDATGSQGEGESILNDAAQWLVASLERASGAKFVQATEVPGAIKLIISSISAAINQNSSSKV